MSIATEHDSWTEADEAALDAADDACVAYLGPGMAGAVHAAVMTHDVPAERRLRLDLMGESHDFVCGSVTAVTQLVALGYRDAAQVRTAEAALGLDVETLAVAGVGPDVAAAFAQTHHQGRWRSLSAWQREGLAMATVADVEALTGLVGTELYLGLAALPDPARRSRVEEFCAANAARISWIESGADLTVLQSVFDALGGGVDNAGRAVGMARAGLGARDVQDFGIRFYDAFGAYGIARVRSSAVLDPKTAKSLHSGLHLHGNAGLDVYERLAAGGLTKATAVRGWAKIFGGCTGNVERMLAAHRLGLDPAYAGAVIAMMGRGFDATDADLASIAVLATAYPDPDALRAFARSVCAEAFAVEHYSRRDGDRSVVLSYLAALTAAEPSRRVAISRAGLRTGEIADHADADFETLWRVGAGGRTEYEAWHSDLSSRWSARGEKKTWPFTEQNWRD